MLKKIQITKLFNRFDYNIELKPEGITIITGPNGYGKTTILKIVYALITKNLAFFSYLPFEKITLVFESNIIEIDKDQQNEFSIIVDGKIYRFSKKDIAKRMKDVSKYIDIAGFKQIDDEHWIDRRTEEIFTNEEMLNRVAGNPEIEIKPFKIDIPDIINVYMIREQRLLKKAVKKRSAQYFIEDDSMNHFNNTIEEYAIELSKNLKEILANSSKIGRELESTYVNRLLKETGRVTKEDFAIRLVKNKLHSVSLVFPQTKKTLKLRLMKKMQKLFLFS